MPIDEFAFRTISELGPLIARGDISPVALTTAQLDRISALDGRLQSYATVMAAQALASARALESEIAEGHYRGPLHGIPIAVKDLCYTAGVRTMGGTPILADHVPSFDATVVARLRAAGAVLLGKLNLTEGAMSRYHPDFAVPRNPWGTDRWTGASSSGSGVATAAGLCYAALGSDTGGSIRFPAAACGVVGLRPTRGRVSRYGILPLAESLDVVGPLARSTRDAALVLEAIAGADPDDPTSAAESVPDMGAELERPIAGTRLGLDREYVSANVTPAVAEAVMAAVGVLAAFGVEVVEVTMPELAPYEEVWPTLCSTEAAVAHRETYPSRANEYGPWFRGWLARGYATEGFAYARATHQRAELAGRLRAALSGIDVLACPAMPTSAQRVTVEDSWGGAGEDVNQVAGRFTRPFALAGLPALTLPCGFDEEGLPLALQLVGQRFSEPLLCRVGQGYEAVTDWGERRPPDFG